MLNECSLDGQVSYVGGQEQIYKAFSNLPTCIVSCFIVHWIPWNCPEILWIQKKTLFKASSRVFIHLYWRKSPSPGEWDHSNHSKLNFSINIPSIIIILTQLPTNWGPMCFTSPFHKLGMVIPSSSSGWCENEMSRYIYSTLNSAWHRVGAQIVLVYYYYFQHLQTTL